MYRAFLNRAIHQPLAFHSRPIPSNCSAINLNGPRVSEWLAEDEDDQSASQQEQSELWPHYQTDTTRPAEVGWLLNYQRMTFANSFICKQFPGAIYIVTATTDTLQKRQQQQHGRYDIAEDVDDVAGGQTDGRSHSVVITVMVESLSLQFAVLNVCGGWLAWNLPFIPSCLSPSLTYLQFLYKCHRHNITTTVRPPCLSKVSVTGFRLTKVIGHFGVKTFVTQSFDLVKSATSPHPVFCIVDQCRGGK